MKISEKKVVRKTKQNIEDVKQSTKNEIDIKTTKIHDISVFSKSWMETSTKF